MRFLVPVTVAALTLFASPALADKAEDCQMQADIVSRAVELRQERTRQAKTVEIMASGEDAAVAEKYLGAVPHIVDWVYSLKRKELKLDPGASYYEACLSQ
ncbi:MAG: hypothetical protein OQK05_02695 [Pseudopelagicola sp.]|nr:hypothetical protein [Pseudopelagicola sp.]